MSNELEDVVVIDSQNKSIANFADLFSIPQEEADVMDELDNLDVLSQTQNLLLLEYLTPIQISDLENESKVSGGSSRLIKHASTLLKLPRLKLII